MAIEATARLYDVDHHRLQFTRLYVSDRYDHGTIRFQARDGQRIDLGQLHESLWATRLSSGTRAGILRLDVTVVGRVVEHNGAWKLETRDASDAFALGTAESSDEELKEKLQQAAADGAPVRVAGTLPQWAGRWPDVLSESPAKPWTMTVRSVEPVEE